MKYVTYISNWYVPKNSLEKAITSYLRTQDRLIVLPENFSSFKQMVIDSIHELNTANKRCAAVQCSWRENITRIKDLPKYEDWRITLNGHDSICIFNIYAVPSDFAIAASPGQAAPNQLNLLDEIEVSRKTMAIGFNTQAEDIIGVYAPDLHPVVKEKMAEAIDRVIENRVEYGQMRKFNESLERKLEGHTIEFDIPRAIISDIENIAKYQPAEKKAFLMRLTRSDINEIKKKWDRDLINELRDLLNHNLVDIYENEPLVLPFFLGHMGEKQYTKEKLLRLLSQGKISAPRIEAMLEAINKEYKVWNNEDELEAQEL